MQSKIDAFDNACIERLYDSGLPPCVCDKHATVYFPSIEILDHNHTQEDMIRSLEAKLCENMYRLTLQDIDMSILLSTASIAFTSGAK